MELEVRGMHHVDEWIEKVDEAKGASIYRNVPTAFIQTDIAICIFPDPSPVQY